MRLFTSCLLAVCLSSLILLATVTASNESSPIKLVSEFSDRAPSATPKTLVLIENEEMKSTHSTFFDQLKSRGHVLEFVVAGQEAIKLSRYGAFFYDNLVLLASGSEDLGEGMNVESLQQFIDSGRSVLFGVNERVSEAMRELATELGIDIDEEGTKVQDDTNNDKAKDLVLGRVHTPASRIAEADGAVKGNLLFRGIGHIAEPSKLFTPVLTGSTSAYVNQPASSEYPAAAGSDILLVSAIQTPGNARVLFAGSTDLFSNELINRSGSGNGVFVRSISMWCFHERGLLRARDLVHWKLEAKHDLSPQSYRVSDQIQFQIVIEEYDGVTHTWQPFQAKDVQLEFTMIDPYWRLSLTPSKTGVYSLQFQVPDVYGVYKFVIPYHRLGYSNLDVSHTVSVHPFRHDEYERFIDVAYPYYTATFTLMAAFFVFGIVFLYQKDE